MAWVFDQQAWYRGEVVVSCIARDWVGGDIESKVMDVPWDQNQGVEATQGSIQYPVNPNSPPSASSSPTAP